MTKRQTLNTNPMYLLWKNSWDAKQNVDLVKTEFLNTILRRREDWSNHCNNSKMFSLWYFQSSKSEKKNTDILLYGWHWTGVKSPGVCRLGLEQLSYDHQTTYLGTFLSQANLFSGGLITQTKNESNFRWLRERKKFNKVWSVYYFPYWLSEICRSISHLWDTAEVVVCS